MPILTYFAVVGSMLMALLFIAEARLGPPAALSVSTQFHGLPAQWKAAPSIPVLTVREGPVVAENLVAENFVQAEPAPRVQSAVVRGSDALAKAKPAGKPKKTKVAKTPRQKPERYAQSGTRLHPFGTTW